MSYEEKALYWVGRAEECMNMGQMDRAKIWMAKAQVYATLSNNESKKKEN